MHVLKDLFHEGGVFVHLVIASGIIGLLADFLQIVFVRRLNLLALILGAAAGTLIVGILAAAVDSHQAFSALAFSGADQHVPLLARGLSVALFPMWLAAAVAGVQCLVGSLAAAVHVNIAAAAAAAEQEEEERKKTQKEERDEKKKGGDKKRASGKKNGESKEKP